MCITVSFVNFAGLHLTFNIKDNEYLTLIELKTQWIPFDITAEYSQNVFRVNFQVERDKVSLSLTNKSIIIS